MATLMDGVHWACTDSQSQAWPLSETPHSSTTRAFRCLNGGIGTVRGWIQRTEALKILQTRYLKGHQILGMP